MNKASLYGLLTAAIIPAILFIGIAFGAGNAGCGYSSQDNDMIGQVKKLVSQTPILCPDRVDADVSLGVLQNGNGSISKEDVTLRVPSDADVAKLKAANGRAVRITYNIKRVAVCGPDHVVTKVEYLGSAEGDASRP